MCDDDDCDCAAEWSEIEPAVTAYQVTPMTLVSNVFGLGRDLFTAVAKFFDACQDDCLAAHNHAALKRQFHEQASMEIETLTATTED